MGARNSKAAAAAGSAKVHGDDEEPHKQNKQEVEDLVYYATPLSIGMADIYDVMSVKIPKNATIPTMKFESRLTTVVDNQPNHKIAVYQGERRKASANQLLGTLMFEGIPPAPKGAKFMTSFDIDTMGNLNVSVKDKTSGWKETKSIPGVGVKGKLQLASAEEMSRQGEKHKSEDEEHLKRASITKAMMEYTIMIRGNAAAGDFSTNVHSAFEDAVGKMLDELKEKAKEFGSEYDTKKSATVMSTFCGIPFRKKDWNRKNKNKNEGKIDRLEEEKCYRRMNELAS